MREWWRGGVIYQVYPRSFQDSNGDGIGDLPGIMRRLDHIAALGVDCIWLSPDLPVAAGRHGLRRLRLQRGRPHLRLASGFRLAWSSRPTRCGLKVIMDQVVSHTSDQHPWFRESRLNRTNARADWYVWADPMPDGSPPNNWPAVFGGRAWEWNPARRQYYLHNFLAEQPDLNFHNPDGAGGGARRHALLARARRRRLPPRHRQLLLPRRASCATIRPTSVKTSTCPMPSTPTTCRSTSSPRASRRTSTSSARPRAARRIPRHHLGRRSRRQPQDPSQLMAEYTSGGDTLHMCYSLRLPRPRVHRRAFPQMHRAVLQRRPRWLAVLELLQPRRAAPRHALGQA